MELLELYNKKDAKSIEKYAQKLIGHTFNEVDSWNLPTVLREGEITYNDKARKGGLGNFIEEQFFCYKANSDSGADFNDAGVELKVTPYEKTKNGKLRAGERLVLTMISYDQAVENDFKQSHLWAKCKLILLIYYLRDRNYENNMDYRIDYARLFTPPKEDLDIMMQDYKVITDKIKAGKANELSESDTNYLGACTKGATAIKSMVPQYYYAPDVKAKRRAFCFKTSYMTYVLNKYIVSADPIALTKEEINKSKATITLTKDKIKPIKEAITLDSELYEPIIKDPTELQGTSFEDFIIHKIDRYTGKTDIELCERFGREYNNNKAQWSDLAYRMLGIKSNKAEEFAKAQIVVKAIRIEDNNMMRENSPLPTFSFMELIEESWEDSELFRYFDETRFLFVVYRKHGDAYVLNGAQLWNMPYKDLNDTVYKGWEKVRDTVKSGVTLTKAKQKNGIIIKNNLPKKSDNPIIHVRPHTSQTYFVFKDGTVFGKGRVSDSDLLPDGQRMTKQSFWLNNTYIVSQLRDDLIK